MQHSRNAQSSDLAFQVRMLKAENARLKQEISELIEINAASKEREQNKVLTYRDRYESLLEDHRKIIKLNSEMEEKMLNMIESIQKERAEFAEKLGELKEKYAESEATIKRLTSSLESYKRDCLIATELLHADPSQFLPASTDGYKSKREDRLSTSSDDHLLSNTSHFLMPTTFPPIAMYSMDPSFNNHHSINHSSDGDSDVNDSKPSTQSENPPQTSQPQESKSNGFPTIGKILEI